MTNVFKLKPSPKIFKNYKSEFPAKTILRCKKSLARLGINLKNLKYEEEKIGKDFLIYGGRLTYNNHYISSGKGITHQLSEASAYAESIERIPFNISPLISYLKLKRDFESCSDFSGYIYGSQKEIKNTIEIKKFFTYFPLLKINRIERSNLAQHWIQAFSLTENKYKKVPHLLIKQISGSNGGAAGNTLEEAITQAFYEICERHSLIEHVINKLSAPTVDPTTIKNENIQKAIELFNSMNIDVEIKDLTLGNKIPVMGILFTNQNLAHEKNTLKKKMFYRTLHAGSHLDLNQAIMRCFTEEWQLANLNIHYFMYHPEFNIVDAYFSQNEKMKVIHKLRGDYAPLISTNRSFENFNFLNKHSPTISLNALSSYDTADFLEDIKIIKDISKKNGWETLIMNYSIPELPLKIVRVVIPSISDILRYNYPNQEKITEFPKKREALLLDDFLLNKGADVKKLVSAAENALVEKIITPYPTLQFLKYSPFELLNILKSSYLRLDDQKKYHRIDDLCRHYSE